MREKTKQKCSKQKHTNWISVWISNHETLEIDAIISVVIDNILGQLRHIMSTISMTKKHMKHTIQ